ncbi:MAG: hypothetical protein RL409_25 [Gemmatimonadota bacterium]
MRKLGLLTVCLAASALAGPRLLGVLTVSDGGTTTNRCTGWGAYAGGGAFTINPLSNIMVQCDAPATVLNDVAGCDGGPTCVTLAANQVLWTTINGNKNLTCHAFASDGGTAGHAVTYNGGHFAMYPLAPADSQVVRCKVYEE